MKPNRERRAVTVAVLLAVALVLTGCTSPASPPVADIVWVTGRITADGPARSVADAWNAAHPAGPHVRIVAMPESSDDQRQLLSLELNAGLPDFDVLDLDTVWTAEFAEHGWLTDISDMDPQIRATSLTAPLASATWNGRLWAAPYTTDAGLLYYRSDLVSRPPTTWHELVDVGTRVGGQHGMAPYVVDGAGSEGLVVDYLEYFWGAGGDLRVDGDRVLFDDDRAAVQAMDFVRTGYATRFFAPGTENKLLEDARRSFQSGGAVFMRSWPYAYQEVNGGDPASRVAGHVGVAPLPTFDGQGTVAALGGHNLAVSRFSRSPDVAEEFVRFASTDPGVQRTLALRWSVAPAAAAAYDDVGTDPVLTTLRRVLPQARPRPVTPLWSEASQVLQQQVTAVTRGRSSPTDAVANLHRLLDADEAGR